MRRLHLLELHEQTWYPSLWREMFQQSMGISMSFFDPYQNMAKPFSRFLHLTKAESFLDLCSGSADPTVKLRNSLIAPFTEDNKPTIVVSDLYPDIEKFKKTKSKFPGIVDYYPQPVNALNPPGDAPRVRTMFSALHHFRPDQVRSILRNAAEKSDGIAIFEATERSWICILQTFPVLIIAAFINGFMLRPYRLKHFLWGILIPVLPITALIDGIVSSLRSYSTEELESFIEEIDAPNFKWEVAKVPIPGALFRATYVFGWRTGSNDDRQNS